MSTTTQMLFCFLLFLPSCGGQDTDWTNGGTLQTATKAEWMKADDKNKLATCADYLATLKKAKGEPYTSDAALKEDAMNMKTCLDIAVQSSYVSDKEPVKQLAINCGQFESK